ncbi:DUF6745 domain-containing protein [Streptomyces sp. NPDC007088]|uniref:DUF6745 domain-containing protein n=1 Tax=Streptomyces sp. NPDC007088 TaxID=3364773 RepID=UPI0036B511AE
MTGPAASRRARATSGPGPVPRSAPDFDSLAELREDWLRHALSTEPADRDRAEAAVRGLHRLIGAPPPRFRWVASPAAFDEQLGTRAIPFRGAPREEDSRRTVPARLADAVHRLRFGLESRLRPLSWDPGWGPVDEFRARNLGPAAARALGVPPHIVVEYALTEPLTRTLRHAVLEPLRSALLPAAHGRGAGQVWHGQYDAYWIAELEAHHRFGRGFRLDREEQHHLGLWAELARSASWWWPGPEECVMTERPAVLHTESVPLGAHRTLRPHHDTGPALVHRDGSSLCAVHGTVVPRWVLDAPSVARIHGESWGEVRRLAIERLGWERYLAETGLPPLAVSPDPGNPGGELRLYHLPAQVRGRAVRVLTVVNGSPEPDGTRRGYGLTVPPHFDDPVRAAAWTYGLDAEAYATLRRRT